MPIVKMPDGAQVQFPDDMPPDQIKGMILKKFPQLGQQSATPATPLPAPENYRDSMLSQGLSGFNQGVANMAGFPVDLANSAIGLGMSGINALTGSQLKPAEEPFLGSKSISDMLNGVSGGAIIAPPTADPTKQFVRRITQEVGANAIPAIGPIAASATPVKAGLTALAAALGSGTGAATAEAVAPGNATAETLGQLIGGGIPLGVSALAGRTARARSAPSVQDLKDQATGFYKQAEANGVTAGAPQVVKLSDDLHQVAVDNGLVSPTGRMNSAYPKVTEALRTIDDHAAGGSMTVPQMQAVRTNLQAVAQSADGSESRLGSILLRKFDDFTAPLSPELGQARDLYHSAMNGKQIETAIELAHSQAGSYSGSGFENALRTQFRALDRQIIKGELKGLTPDEIASIRAVANGGPISNILRYIGKAAPTGIVSAGLGAGAGYLAGGNIGAIAIPAAGELGRVGATALTNRAAQMASALARNGGVKQSMPLFGKDQSALAQALLVGQQANAPQSGAR